jgi:hypothetical protein
MMPTKTDVLNREFLEVRAKILELAAALDRLQRAEGSLEGDPRVARIQNALDTLRASATNGRAEDVQLIFSLPYDDDWRKQYKL